MPYIDAADFDGFDPIEQQEASPSWDDSSPYDDAIAQAASQFQIDPFRWRAVVKAESNFDAEAVSHAGAQGLTQLMPGTAKELGVKNPFDPSQNLVGGAQYFRKVSDMFDGDETKAHAAYNWGPGNVRKAIKKYGDEWLKHAPRETQEYVKKIERFYGEYNPQIVQQKKLDTVKKENLIVEDPNNIVGEFIDAKDMQFDDDAPDPDEPVDVGDIGIPDPELPARLLGGIVAMPAAGIAGLAAFAVGDGYDRLKMANHFVERVAGIPFEGMSEQKQKDVERLMTPMAWIDHAATVYGDVAEKQFGPTTGAIVKTGFQYLAYFGLPALAKGLQIRISKINAEMSRGLSVLEGERLINEAVDSTMANPQLVKKLRELDAAAGVKEAVKKQKEAAVALTEKEKATLKTTNEMRVKSGLEPVDESLIIKQKEKRMAQRRVEGKKKVEKFRKEKKLPEQKVVKPEEVRGKLAAEAVNKEVEGLVKYDGEQAGIGPQFTTQIPYAGMKKGQTFYVKGKPSAGKIKKAILQKAQDHKAILKRIAEQTKAEPGVIKRVVNEIIAKMKDERGAIGFDIDKISRRALAKLKEPQYRRVVTIGELPPKGEVLRNPKMRDVQNVMNKGVKEMRGVINPDTGEMILSDSAGVMHKGLAKEAGIDFARIKNDPELAFTITSPRQLEFRMKKAESLRGPTIKGKPITKETLPKVLKEENYAILTAENPMGKVLSKTENVQLNKGLKSYLDKEGIPYTDAKGKFGSAKESPVFITDITKKQAIELAKKFNQESVLTKEGLVFQDGSVAPAKSIKFGEMGDNYTSIKIGGEEIKFAVEIGEKAGVATTGEKGLSNLKSVAEQVEAAVSEMRSKAMAMGTTMKPRGYEHIKVPKGTRWIKRGDYEALETFIDSVRRDLLAKAEPGAESRHVNEVLGKIKSKAFKDMRLDATTDVNAISRGMQKYLNDWQELVAGEQGILVDWIGTTGGGKEGLYNVRGRGYSGHSLPASKVKEVLGEMQKEGLPIADIVAEHPEIAPKKLTPAQDVNVQSMRRSGRDTKPTKFSLRKKLTEETGAVGRDISDVNKFMKELAAEEATAEQAKMLKEKKYAGSINMNRQEISTAAKKVENFMMEQQGPKAVVTNKETLAQAEKLIEKWQKDPKAWIRSINKIKKGQSPTIAESTAHRILNANNFEMFIEMEKALREGKITEEAFNNFQSQMKMQAVDVVDFVSSERGRALQAQNIVVGKAEAMKAINMLEKNMNKAQLERFNKVNWDDPVSVKEFIRELPDPKLMDYVYEFWYNSILSGIPTHAVNTISTGMWTMFQVPHKVLVASLEKLMSPMSTKPRTAFLNEIGPMLSGFKSGAKRGGKAALDTLIRGKVTEFETKWAQEVGSSMNAWQRSPHKALRTAAPYMSVPTKGLRAMDVYFNSIAFDGEIAAFARRLSNKKGLKGAKRSKFETEFRLNPSKEAIASASKQAKYSTFMDDPGFFSQAVIKVRSQAPGGRFVVPFVNTIGNLLKRGVEMTPALGLTLKKGQPLSQVLAKQIEGAVITYLLAEKMDRGEIIGDVPDNPAEKKAFYRQGKIPWSIKWGDNYYSYRRIEPFNTVISTMAIAHDKIKNAKDDAEATGIFLSIVDDMKDNFIDSAYLQGVSRLFFNRWKTDDGSHIKNFAQNVISSFVPYSSFFRSMSRSYEALMEGDVTLRERERPGGAWYDPYVMQLPSMPKKFPSRLNVWGEDIKLQGGMFRQWLPYKMSTTTNDPVEIGLEKLNVHPDLPAKKIKHKGKMITLDTDIYRDYAISAGHHTYNYYKRIMQRKSFQRMLDKAQTDENMYKNLAKQLHTVYTGYKKKYRAKALKEQLQRNKRRR